MSSKHVHCDRIGSRCRNPLALETGRWRRWAEERPKSGHAGRGCFRGRTHRSPIALALAADGSRLLVANQTAGTVSLINPQCRASVARA